MAYNFDASDDYIDCGTINLSIGEISMCAMVNVDSFQSSFPNIRQVAGIEDNTTSDQAFMRFGNAGLINDGQFQWVIQRTSALTSATTFSTGTNYFFVCTWDGADMYIYVNGAQDATKAATGTNTANKGFQIGRMTEGQHGGRLFDGKMGHVAVWNRGLSASEAIAMSKNWLSPLFYPRGLIHYWPLNDRSSPALNLTNSTNTGTLNGSPSVLDDFPVIYPNYANKGIYYTAAAAGGVEKATSYMTTNTFFWGG